MTDVHFPYKELLDTLVVSTDRYSFKYEELAEEPAVDNDPSNMVCLRRIQPHASVLRGCFTVSEKEQQTLSNNRMCASYFH